ncbi:MAG: hypothetical protein ACJ76H_10650 [Bacteriovoracaceae bacterium]
MKYFLLILAFVASSAFAQTNHMIEMSTTSATLGALSFTDHGSRTDKSLYFSGNYAYKISERVQLAVQGNYSHFDSNFSNTESYGLNLGAIYNLDDDFTNAPYVSLYGGMNWFHSYGHGNGSTEAWNGRAAFGKRFSLSNINLPNVTYSPEISYTRSEYTSGGYGSNTVSIRFLQFSAFF